MRSFRQSRLIWCLTLVAGLGLLMLLGGCEEEANLDEVNERLDRLEEPSEPPFVVSRANVVRTNANVAFAGYADAYATAVDLKDAIHTFVYGPTESTLQAAKMAWLRAREAYQPTEVYRFRPGPIEDIDDGMIEPRVNGWPLGEALIDYVADGIPDGDAGDQMSVEAANIAYPGNIISDTVSLPTIDGDTIMPFVEFNDDRNIGTGYHAIEFLLWGQDLNEGETMWTTPRDDTPGNRPVSDYYQNTQQGMCTSGPDPADHMICQRRATYLKVVANLLVDDLESLVDAWNPNGENNHYASYTHADNVNASLAGILQSMGRMGFGELAGERINIARANNSQEDEHSCFSDNTHRDILLNIVGIQNQYLGEYSFEGDMVEGPGVYDLLMAVNPELAEDLRMALEDSIIKAEVIDAKAMAGKPFDQQIEEGPENPDIKGLIAALVRQTALIEQAIQALDLEAEDLEQDTEEDIKDLA